MSNKEKKSSSTILRHKVFFTSDLHWCHDKMAYHCPGRCLKGGFDPSEPDAHDNYLLEEWNKTVGKHDVVYILGDLFLKTPEKFIEILKKLNGKKYLFLGNHDKIKKEMEPYFEKISQQGVLLFKEHNFEFLEEDFRVFVNHYPVEIWDKKQYGAVHAHGHMHGALDEKNRLIPDLRVDVGWDSDLGECGLVPMEKLYKHFKNKTGGMLFEEYIKTHKEILF